MSHLCHYRYGCCDFHSKVGCKSSTLGRLIILLILSPLPVYVKTSPITLVDLPPSLPLDYVSLSVPGANPRLTGQRFESIHAWPCGERNLSNLIGSGFQWTEASFVCQKNRGRPSAALVALPGCLVRSVTRVSAPGDSASRHSGVTAPCRWIPSGSTGLIRGHVDTEELYFENHCFFFASILRLKSGEHSCSGKCVLFYIANGPPALSLFSPLWEEVKRRRQDQLLWHLEAGFQRLRRAHVAHVQGQISEGGLLATAGSRYPHLDRGGPLVCLQHVAVVSSLSLLS